MCKALVANLGVQMHDQGLNPFVGGRGGGGRDGEKAAELSFLNVSKEDKEIH